MKHINVCVYSTLHFADKNVFPFDVVFLRLFCKAKQGTQKVKRLD